MLAYDYKTWLSQQSSKYTEKFPISIDIFLHGRKELPIKVQVFGPDKYFYHRHVFDPAAMSVPYGYSCGMAMSPDFSGFTRIGDRVCTDIVSPKENITVNIPDATEIGSYFFSKITNIVVLDLSSMTNVSKIGSKFLLGSDLCVLHLAQMPRMGQLSNGFVMYAKYLRSIDLAPLSNVTHIGDNFLFGCESLATLDFSPLRNLTHIGVNFMAGCKSLVELDLTAADKLQSIGDHFLFECCSLLTIAICLNPDTRVGDFFAVGCPMLIYFSINELSKLNKRPVRPLEQTPLYAQYQRSLSTN